MNQVIVMMSSYNGEKYIEQQIESILNQKGVNVQLIIRDDGSSDGTIDIIKRYKSIIVFEGDNLGPKKSFMKLVKSVPEADYYAFADQDDIWRPNKLERAICRLKDVVQYGLYTSSYDLVDNHLNIIKKNAALKHEYSLCESIMYRAPLGCTMVMNKRLFYVIKNSNPSDFRMHDHWAMLTAEAIQATIIVDQVSTMLYRQHGDNVVGNNRNIVIRCKRLIKSALHNKNERQKQAISVFENYKEYLDENVSSILKEVGTYRESLANRVQLAFDKRFYVKNKKVLFLFRLSVLLGIF